MPRETKTANSFSRKTPQFVRIQEEFPDAQTGIPTSGRAQISTRNFTAAASTTTNYDFSFKLPIGLCAGYYYADTATSGDKVRFFISPDTMVAVTSQAVQLGDGAEVGKEINVSSTSYFRKGYYVTINDGQNSDDLGRIINIDSSTGKILCENATVHSYSSMVPLYMTIKVISEMYIQNGVYYSFGTEMIGASYIPANTVIRVQYENMTATPKEIVFRLEYRY